MYAVTNGSQGVAIISDYNVTLLNGAQLTNTHTLGQNLLNN
jgi:hypothetical protein